MDIQVSQEMQVGEDMFVMVLPIAAVKEADVNAQVMQPAKFERLTENIRNRGMVESLPFVSWPGREGIPVMVSGHHRSRAARAAGLTEIPYLVDTRPMELSERTSKQISHNELNGEHDQQVLAQLIRMIHDVDDLLATGLSEQQLSKLGEVKDTSLGTPHAAFDWKTFTCLFLPHQMDA